MAKQLFYPPPPIGGGDADTRVELVWRRYDTVQIATTKLQPDAPRDQDYYPGPVRNLPVPPAVTTTGPGSVDVTAGRYVASWQGEFVELNRAQVNELIRSLRVARDNAYGRNE